MHSRCVFSRVCLCLVFLFVGERPPLWRGIVTPTPTEPEPLDHALCDVSFTTEDVSEALLALDPNKATGPDGIHCRLLKETARQIAPSVTQLFNLSLCCGAFPDDWKLANIIPVYKKEKNST